MTTPAGLNAIYGMLRQIYPDQENPLQVSALVKYWFNGPDPLDYITMYANSGNERLGVPPHWHYISCGLSDLYGDGRVHDVAGDSGLSGFGFELTFRLKRAPGELSPPTWPAQLMQSLAKYVFQTETAFCCGDHVSWHEALDHRHEFIEHMLVTDDPQLSQLNTPFGSLNFVQIIGVCSEELQAAQQWNGIAVLNLLRQIPSAGGNWLLTDITRKTSIFDANPALLDLVEAGINEEGSDLSGVGAKCWWEECSIESIHKSLESASNRRNIRASSSTLSIRIRSSLANYRHDIVENRDVSRMSNYSSVSELLQARPINGALHLRFNLESASLLPLAIRGRLAHGRHFTFKSVQGNAAITLVTCDIAGKSVNKHYPYAALRTWLQILIPDDFLEVLANDLDELQNSKMLSLPRHYVWPERRLMIAVVENT